MSSDSELDEYGTDLENERIVTSTGAGSEVRPASVQQYRRVKYVTGSYNHGRVDVALNSHKQSLDLARRHLGPSAFISISAALQASPMISVLDVRYNSLGEGGGIDLILALIKNYQVTELNLSGNSLGKTKVAAYIAVLLAHNNIIISLDISENGFTEEDVRLIAGGILENDYLKELSLAKNDFSTVGAGYLGRALAVNGTLEKLNLSGNAIRIDGGVILGKGIRANFCITHVDLSSNGLAYDGALSIRNCLLHNTRIESVDISDNRINWEGALVLAHALEMNKTLQVFRAGNNPLTTTGCMDIIDAVSVNRTLIQLDLQNVNVVREFTMQIRIIQEYNSEFHAEYGKVVHTHDVLGLRTKRRIHPMQKIVQYLLGREIRPVELLRMMDKSVSFKLTAKEFMERCRKMGIGVESYDEAEFMDYILSRNEGGQKMRRSGVEVSYQVLLASINDYIEQEREYRQSQRRKLQALTKRQRDLLNKELPPLNIRADIDKVTEGLLTELEDESKESEAVLSQRLSVSITGMRDDCNSMLRKSVRISRNK